MTALKSKGTSFETLVVNWLRVNGHPDAARLPLAGARDMGDVTLGGSAGRAWAIECKNRRAIDLAGAVDEAETERVNAGKAYAAAVIKRPRKGSAGDAYVVMRLETFADIARLVEAGE